MNRKQNVIDYSVSLLLYCRYLQSKDPIFTHCLLWVKWHQFDFYSFNVVSNWHYFSKTSFCFCFLLFKPSDKLSRTVWKTWKWIPFFTIQCIPVEYFLLLFEYKKKNKRDREVLVLFSKSRLSILFSNDVQRLATKPAIGKGFEFVLRQ